MSRLRALAANMAAVITGKAATAVVGLLTVVALTRHLGPTEFGYYRTVLTYSAFAAVLADSGLYMVTLREMSRGGTHSARVLGNALPLRVVSTGSVLLANTGRPESSRVRTADESTCASAVPRLMPAAEMTAAGSSVLAPVTLIVRTSNTLVP